MFRWKKHTLQFSFPAGTSRGILKEKESWFLIHESPAGFFVGECGRLKGLSPDPDADYERRLSELVDELNHNPALQPEWLNTYSSIRMGLEMLRRQIKEGSFAVDTPFGRGERGLPINGLIWMGDAETMKSRIKAKLNEGFRCLKLKIGALSRNEEHELIKLIRSEFSPSDLEIRVDANGAFTFSEAQVELDFLATQHIHSIEQPIAAGQHEAMARLCEASPVPIALDEELIGLDVQKSALLIQSINPAYLILKPSFLGGAMATKAWVELAQKGGMGWWITSALESNIGLYYLAVLAEELGISMPQGLGTGGLYTNNIPGSLHIHNAALWNNSEKGWDLSMLAP